MNSFNQGGLQQEQMQVSEVLQSDVGLIMLGGNMPANAIPPRVGDLLAKNAAGKYIVRKYTFLTVAGANLDTVITVNDPYPFSVGEAFQVSGEAATTITAIDLVAKTISLAAALTGTRAIGLFAKGTVASEAVAVAIYPWGVTDRQRAYEKTIAFAVRGNFMYSKIKNLDAQGVTELGAVYHSAFDLLAA